jgi:hypothetical protein
MPISHLLKLLLRFTLESMIALSPISLGVLPFDVEGEADRDEA